MRSRLLLALAPLAACDVVTDDPPPPPPPPPPLVFPAPLALVDTAAATVVGDGTPASCTEDALRAALATSSLLRFDCGDEPVTVTLSSPIVVGLDDPDLVLDGGDGGLVTLDGGDATRLVELASSFERDTPRVTVQRLGFAHGRAQGTDLDGGGAAIHRTGGSLDVIDCVFSDNVGNVSGQDTAGGAIFSLGGGTTTITGSTFVDNACSNGGALGNLGNDLVVVNSVFERNAATGTGGNPGDGGNGGTIAIDGEGRGVTLCGITIRESRANAFGGAVFRVSYLGTEPTDIDRSVIDGAVIPDGDPSMAGGLYLQGTTVTMQNSTVKDCAARGAGGAFFGPGASIFLDNVSFLDNVATSSLGGGVFLQGLVTGRIRNATFAGNAAPGDVAFGGAIVGDGGPVAMTNTLILGSVAGNGFNPVSCTTSLQDGAGSFQFPVARAGGGSDDPDALCAPGITVADVPLDDVDDSGVVPVRRPAAAGAALVVGAGADCPPQDALGAARDPDACTSGAVEVAPAP
jgi:hypothetical protein